MKAYRCPVCGSGVFFESIRCEACRSDLLFDVATDTFSAAAQPCANAGTNTNCNWIQSDADGYCLSCRLDTHHENGANELPFQEAKRRTLRQLYRTGVQTVDVAPQLRFDLRSSSTTEQVITGHADGLITIDTAEGDPVHLAETRAHLGEPYRTPLGHIRHELGHWFWATAVGNVFSYDRSRTMFGDEREDYRAALQTHYAQPDTGQWADRYLSHYASAHPWEDFAESFAHVLHMGDTLETAVTHGLLSLPDDADFNTRYRSWISLSLALNDLNRSMGTPDPYPFVVPPTAVGKLRFIDQALRSLAP